MQQPTTASMVSKEEDYIYRASLIEPELLHVAGLGVSSSICSSNNSTTGLQQLFLCYLHDNSDPRASEKLGLFQQDQQQKIQKQNSNKRASVLVTEAPLNTKTTQTQKVKKQKA